MRDDNGYLVNEGGKMICIDCYSTEGVELRYPGYGIKNYPRCEACGEARLEREDENKRKYLSEIPPDDYDFYDAGEYWGEDDY